MKLIAALPIQIQLPTALKTVLQNVKRGDLRSLAAAQAVREGERVRTNVQLSANKTKQATLIESHTHTQAYTTPPDDNNINKSKHVPQFDGAAC